MPAAPNHSGNLPRVFERCPGCGKKGLYRHGGQVWASPDGLTGFPPGRRCKYCAHRIPDATQAEFERQLNQKEEDPLERRSRLLAEELDIKERRYGRVR